MAAPVPQSSLRQIQAEQEHLGSLMRVCSVAGGQLGGSFLDWGLAVPRQYMCWLVTSRPDGCHQVSEAPPALAALCTW